jgi:hypothetical protein
MKSKMMICGMFMMIQLMIIVGMPRDACMFAKYCENQFVIYSRVGELILSLMRT